MTFSSLKFKDTKMPKGIQAMEKFGKYKLSVIQNEFSYGGKQGLYEIAVFDGSDQCELPGITEPGDTVKGFLNESDVEMILKKLASISGQNT